MSIRAWEEFDRPGIVKFHIGNKVVGYPFAHVTYASYDGRAITIELPNGEIVIKGRSAEMLFDDFCNHIAQSIRANGEHITSVEFFPAKTER